MTNPLKYEAFLARHENSCVPNHKRSAGAITIVGTKQISQPSIEKHDLRYVKCLRDCNSKSFCEGVKLENLECIGHVQKR